jgi:peptidyl-prolyl cis-trans isomerase A (cyclophilin A)
MGRPGLTRQAKCRPASRQAASPYNALSIKLKVKLKVFGMPVLALRFARAALLAALSWFWMNAAPAQTVRLNTNLGDIDIELQADKSPATVANFTAYVKAGFFDGVIFHRVIETFMVQTGGYTADLRQKTTRKPIPLESDNGLPNVRGSVAMARTSDPQSATSQFFINVVDNPFLDKANARDGHGYAVFGRVVAGMEVVDQIKAAPTRSSGMFANLPVQPITIVKASVIKP